jgi:D-xylose transport system substrate-binding protein
MKRVLTIALSMAVTGLLVGGLASPAAARAVKVGFLLKTMQEERHQRDKAVFIAKAESMGAKVYFD